MKKIISIFSILILIIFLTSCPGRTVFPNMVKYDEEVILEAVKEKYNVEEFIMTGAEFHGHISKYLKEDDELEIYYFKDPKFSDEFINPDNIAKALKSFAGENGGYYTQMQYHDFICYVAIGKVDDGTYKYFYYNTNIDKDEEIIDTIGSSDYNLGFLPTEITKENLDLDLDWTGMNYLFDDVLLKKEPMDYSYENEKLSTSFEYKNHKGNIEYYYEDNKIKYDIYLSDYLSQDNIKGELIYSQRPEYGVLYYKEGIDFSNNLLFNYDIIIDDEDYVRCSLHIEVVNIEGTILHSEMMYSTKYSYRANQDPIYKWVINEQVYDKIFYLGEDKNIDYDKHFTAKLEDYYIFYEKEKEA